LAVISAHNILYMQSREESLGYNVSIQTPCECG